MLYLFANIVLHINQIDVSKSLARWFSISISPVSAPALNKAPMMLVWSSRAARKAKMQKNAFFLLDLLHMMKLNALTKNIYSGWI